MRCPHLIQRRRILKAIEIMHQWRIERERLSASEPLTMRCLAGTVDSPMSRKVLPHRAINNTEYTGKWICRTSIEY